LSNCFRKRIERGENLDLQKGGEGNNVEQFVSVLEIPPVDSPKTMVKMAIYSDIKQGKVTA
jgi:hypothetical protein